MIKNEELSKIQSTFCKKTKNNSLVIKLYECFGYKKSNTKV